MNNNETLNLQNDDAILPEGFDPNDENFSVDKFFEEPAAEEPTTVQEPVAEDAPVAEPQVEEQLTVEQQLANADVKEPTKAIEQAQVPQTIKVKFNHEERELSFDEAATLAQKGMNYDKLEEKIKAFETANAQTERLAKQLGYGSAKEMIEAAGQNYRDRMKRELVEAGNTEAMAEFLVDQKLGKATIIDTPATEPQVEPTPEPTKSAIPDRRKEEIDEFIKAYPDVTKLPDEVIKDNQNGVRLLVAYERYQNKAAQSELAILRQNQAAAAKAPVTGVAGKAAPDPVQPEDPFMKGFDIED